MKIKLLLIIICICTSVSAQKKYHFNYAFIVKQNYKNKTSNSVFLANSTDNSFRLYANSTKDSLTYAMTFGDEKGVGFYASMKKADFNKAETIVATCKEVYKTSTIFKHKALDYNFINFKDTIINSISYYHYAIKCNNSVKYQKKRKILSYHYIVDKSDANFLPLFNHSTAYETWILSKNIPNGYPKTIYFKNYNEEYVGEIEFENVIKVDKYTTVPEECDYSNTKLKSSFTVN